MSHDSVFSMFRRQKGDRVRVERANGEGKYGDKGKQDFIVPCRTRSWLMNSLGMGGGGVSGPPPTGAGKGQGGPRLSTGILHEAGRLEIWAQSLSPTPLFMKLCPRAEPPSLGFS